MSDIKVRKKDIQEAKQPDVVLQEAQTIFDWIVAHKNALLGGLVVLAVVVAGVSFARSSAAEKRHETGSKLSQAVELVDRPVGEGAPAAPGEKSFNSQEEKTKAMQEAFDAVQKAAPGSDAARAASLKLAQLQLQAGQHDEAIKGFESYLQGGDKLLSLFALENLGYAYEGKGDTAKAGETFAKLAEAGAPALALYHQARLAEKAGKKDEARGLYQRLIKEHEKAAIISEARVRLDLLDAPPAGQGALEAPAAPAADEGKTAAGKQAKSK